MGIATRSGFIHAVAGMAAGGTTARTSHYMYDPDLNSWTTKATLGASAAVAYAEILDGVLYSFGNTHTYAYDPVLNSWTAKASRGVNQLWAGSAVVNDLAYIIGGGNSASLSTTTAITDIVNRYDPVANSWVTRSPLPQARQAIGACAVSNGKIYVFGGETSAGDPGTQTAGVLVYDPAADTW